MKQYLELLQDILDHGTDKPDRTGTGTRSVFGRQLRFNLQDGFPILTTKKLNLKAVIVELLWFLHGGDNIKELNDQGVHIWDEWADDKGNLGPVYGKQWRRWEVNTPHFYVIDQIADVIKSIKENPHSRRHIVTAWNPAEVDDMALPPCHCFFQFYVTPRGETLKPGLSCQMYQRSADVFLGVPFNITSYSLLTMMVAQVCNLWPGEFIHTFGDVHIYKNHFKQVNLQLTRQPRNLPIMTIDPKVTSIDGFKYEDFLLEGYEPYPGIKAEISV